MPILLTSAAFLIAAVCAGLMGYAIQRGATCTVAAVDEVVSKRVQSSGGMVEASIWVAGGLVLAQRHFTCWGKMPAGYPLSYLTVRGRRASGARRVRQSSLRVRRDRALRFRRVGVRRHAGRILCRAASSSRTFSRPPRTQSCPTARPCWWSRCGSPCCSSAFLLWRLVRALLALLVRGIRRARPRAPSRRIRDRASGRRTQRPR